jgi:hypothetical protein
MNAVSAERSEVVEPEAICGSLKALNKEGTMVREVKCFLCESTTRVHVAAEHAKLVLLRHLAEHTFKPRGYINFQKLEAGGLDIVAATATTLFGKPILHVVISQKGLHRLRRLSKINLAPSSIDKRVEKTVKVCGLLEKKAGGFNLLLCGVSAREPSGPLPNRVPAEL